MPIPGYCQRKPASESRNPKQIQKSKIGKSQHDERELVFGIAASDFGFVSDFGFRASGLDRRLFGDGNAALCVAVLMLYECSAGHFRNWASFYCPVFIRVQ
jgi:hypothetical protein